MPRPGPRRRFVGARMSVEQVDGLRAAADLSGVDVSEVVRRAVDEYLARVGGGAPGPSERREARAVAGGAATLR